MSRRITRRWWFASLLGLLLIGDGPSPGQAPRRATTPPPSSAFDPKLEPVRRALASWDSRQGPDRAVVDQVCLVPDLPTFLEAVASWDAGHYFPILFDDVESSFRFIRAFRPARIVRMPRPATPIAAGKAWDRAVEAVGASWTPGDDQGPARLPGDLAPKTLGPTPPGVVFSTPTAPMLAGAVALAAGRFQPLIRLDSDQRFADVLSLEDVDAFGRSIARKVGERRPDFEGLGDDCDFLTVAGDYPYRYRDANGEQEAVDDRIGRVAGADLRWAYAGRLLGDPTESVYRAMCSLFLQPESALMFNGYDEAEAPWSNYLMRTASLRLSATLPTSQVSGELQATLGGWHETFDPSNGFGLILINSHGSPTEFNLRGGPAHAPDIPRGVPSAVLMIHSFSAARPDDPATVAGRWLANGAFLFFGSMNEPFLDAFRTPRLVGELIALGAPLVAAARQIPGERRGMPWRLVFLGDPLYRIKAKPGTDPTSRLDRWEPTVRWPSYAESPRPPDGRDVDLFTSSLKAALARLQGAGRGQSASAFEDLAEALPAVQRAKLPQAFRPVHEALLIEVLLMARKRTALKARLLAVPEAERTPSTRRTLETLLTVDLHLGLAQKDPSKARAAWVDLMKTGVAPEFKQQATALVGRLAEGPAQLDDWRGALKAVLGDRSRSADSEIISAELRRVDEALKAKR